MLKSNSSKFLVSKLFILAAYSAACVLSAQEAPPKDLVQYVRDAIKAGESPAQIQQNAVSSGWSAATVSKAVGYVRDQDATGAAALTATAVAGTAANTEAKPEPVKTIGTIGSKPSVNRGVPDDYKIGAGDVLEINVWKEPDASVKSAMVRTDGRISMPLLKDVEVVGLTPMELEKLLTEKLSSLINSPDVTVIITGTGSKKIYVQGKVNHEGPIAFTYNMTVMQALSEAGGITIYAKKSKIYVLRTDNGKATRLAFDYSAVLKGQRLDTNIQLQAGDMIVVP
ncbi:MAG TPA: polysaccharide biosynthesis/export family protein [Bryobacteraceae bacterium]|nr:polysaccharide biosynthesis/export family protein [Bryobacteraceae bacterium]